MDGAAGDVGECGGGVLVVEIADRAHITCDVTRSHRTRVSSTRRTPTALTSASSTTEQHVDLASTGRASNVAPSKITDWTGVLPADRCRTSHELILIGGILIVCMKYR